tara:strand:+ start:324 stop:1442 length:1119 start_codon:yes stop_codon:yes gene_type:complete
MATLFKTSLLHQPCLFALFVLLLFNYRGVASQNCNSGGQEKRESELTCQDCSVGRYAPVGTEVCRDCPNGYYSKFPKQSKCEVKECLDTETPYSNFNADSSIKGRTGDNFTVVCQPGYTGGGIITCLSTPSNEQQTFSVVQCIPNGCAPTQVPNSDKSASESIKDVRTGESVQVVCNSGYEYSVGTAFRDGFSVCLADGTMTVIVCQIEPSNGYDTRTTTTTTTTTSIPVSLPVQIENNNTVDSSVRGESDENYYSSHWVVVVGLCMVVMGLIMVAFCGIFVFHKHNRRQHQRAITRFKVTEVVSRGGDGYGEIQQLPPPLPPPLPAKPSGWGGQRLSNPIPKKSVVRVIGHSHNSLLENVIRNKKKNRIVF